MQHRRQRLEGEMQRCISRILLERLQVPGLPLLSVTAVRASADLQRAEVYVSILGGAPETRRALDALRRARGFVRRELGAALRLRRVPELEFHIDEHLQREVRVEEILAKLKGGEDGEE
jgi:ribosome-binding factor A